MSDDPIATLERELVDAARRRAAAASSPDDVSVHRARRRRHLGGMFAAAASILVVLLVAGGALLVLHRASVTTSSSSLVSVWAKRLAVLRRPQTRADRVAIYRDGNSLPSGVVQLSSIRFARRALWGTPILLGVIVRGSGRGQLAVSAGAGFGVQHFDHNRILAYEGQGRSVTQLVLVVADGITRVQIHGRGRPKTFRPVGNVIATAVSGACCSTVSVTAYGDDGRVVARFQAPLIPTRKTPVAR